MDVAIFLTLLRGNGRSNVLTGKSVHNQRIERLWRDVATNVTEQFYVLFYQLEDAGMLDISNDVHLCALQLVFVPIINERMNAFRKGWNSHRCRTADNQSPQQLWLSGMLRNANSAYTATTELFQHTSSLTVRVEEALQHFNLTLQHFQTTDDSVPISARYTVDTVTAAHVAAEVATVIDFTAKYQKALEIITSSSAS